MQDVYFRAGEVVNAGQPVLALLPPGNRRIRFYVPEPRALDHRARRAVAVTCDSCPAGSCATIVFISQEAEYTPPVIFSEQERAKLVFRVEAQPAATRALPIGLPVTVRRDAPEQVAAMSAALASAAPRAAGAPTSSSTSRA